MDLFKIDKWISSSYNIYYWILTKIERNLDIATNKCRSKFWQKQITSTCGIFLPLPLVSENDLFLTLGSGTSSARNENLRPLLNTNIPLISGKYGLINHFWPFESRFLMRLGEKHSIFSKPSKLPILISWNLILYTF